MAKKYKRQARSSARPISTSSMPSPVVEVPAYRRVTTGEFNPDYTPIIKDLKRIGILAGTFFVILIILSFVL